MLYNGVGWVDKPNVSDGLWACWVFNPTYPLCHFFIHSTIPTHPTTEIVRQTRRLPAQERQNGRFASVGLQPCAGAQALDTSIRLTPKAGKGRLKKPSKRPARANKNRLIAQAVGQFARFIGVWRRSRQSAAGCCRHFSGRRCRRFRPRMRRRKICR